jgi:Mg2+ and Co2+ transporter CorA
MCYECFEKHTSQLINEYTQLQRRFADLTNLFNDKRHFLAQFQEHCLRSVNSAFDEALNDLQNLRRESINYVRHQFNDAEVSLMMMKKKID